MKGAPQVKRKDAKLLRDLVWSWSNLARVRMSVATTGVLSFHVVNWIGPVMVL